MLRKEGFYGIIKLEEIRPIIALIALASVSALITPHFFTLENLMNIMGSMTIVAMATLGEALVILMGSIDLSVGSQIGLGCMLTAALLEHYNFSAEMTFFTVLLAGAMIGFTNGIVVTKGRMPSFIITLASLSIIRGAIFLYSSLNIPIFNERFLALGGSVGVFPDIFLILVAGLIVFDIFCRFFKTGSHIRAIGGNETAARYLGLDADGVKALVFTLTGALCAIAGLMMAARLGASYPSAGEGYELDVIAAAVVGGASLTGGKGSLIGAFTGAALMTTIVNSMLLLNIEPFWQYVVKGIVLVIAATVYRGALPFGR